MSRIRSRPPLIRPRVGAFKEPTGPPVFDLDKITENTRGTSAEQKSRKGNEVVWKLINYKPRPTSVNKENYPPMTKNIIKEMIPVINKDRTKRTISNSPTKLPRMSFQVPTVYNSFYDNLEKMDKLLEGMSEIRNQICIPHGFFSPPKKRVTRNA